MDLPANLASRFQVRLAENRLIGSPPLRKRLPAAAEEDNLILHGHQAAPGRRLTGCFAKPPWGGAVVGVVLRWRRKPGRGVQLLLRSQLRPGCDRCSSELQPRLDGAGLVASQSEDRRVR